MHQQQLLSVQLAMPMSQASKREYEANSPAAATSWKPVGIIFLAIVTLLAIGIYAFYDLFYRERVTDYSIETAEDLYNTLPVLEQFDVLSCQLSYSIDEGTRSVPAPSIVDLWGVVELSPEGAAQLRRGFTWTPSDSTDICYGVKSLVPAGIDLLNSSEFMNYVGKQAESWMVSCVHIEADPSGTTLYLSLSKG